MHVVQDNQCHSSVFLLYFATELVFPSFFLSRCLSRCGSPSSTMKSFKSQVHHWRQRVGFVSFTRVTSNLIPHNRSITCRSVLSPVQPSRRKTLTVYPIMHTSPDVQRAESSYRSTDRCHRQITSWQTHFSWREDDAPLLETTNDRSAPSGSPIVVYTRARRSVTMKMHTSSRWPLTVPTCQWRKPSSAKRLRCQEAERRSGEPRRGALLVRRARAGVSTMCLLSIHNCGPHGLFPNTCLRNRSLLRDEWEGEEEGRMAAWRDRVDTRWRERESENMKRPSRSVRDGNALLRFAPSFPLCPNSRTRAEYPPLGAGTPPCAPRGRVDR